MKPRLFLLAAWYMAMALSPLFALEKQTMRSQSGQFIVSGLPAGKPLVGAPAGGAGPADSYLRLDPTLIAVSFERIKQAILEELALGDKWRGTVYISVHPVREAGEEVVVTSVHHADGWSYRIELPELLDRERFVRAAVHVLLTEIANRRSGARQAELPPWLAEGLAAHLQAATLSTLAVEPETATIRKERNPDPLRGPRQILRDQSPLTLNQLNMPTEEQWSGRNAPLYQSCSQVLVCQLLRLKNGRACLRDMLLILAEHLNWQTAFLRAFQNHFPRLIDADKWWSLSVIHLAGRDLTSAWPHDTSWNQLDDILITPLQVRLDARAMPMTTQIKLQTILAEWEPARQSVVLRIKINHLNALSLRTSPSLMGLIRDYRTTMETYLQQCDKHNGSLWAKVFHPNLKSPSRDTIKRLDELDARRETLRQPPEEETAAVR